MGVGTIGGSSELGGGSEFAGGSESCPFVELLIGCVLEAEIVWKSLLEQF